MTIASLNRFGIHWFDGFPAISYAISPENSQGTTSYSYRLAMNFGAGRQYGTYLRNIRGPGCSAWKYGRPGSRGSIAPLLQRLNANIPVTIVPNMKHADMIVTPVALQVVVRAITLQ